MKTSEYKSRNVLPRFIPVVLAALILAPSAQAASPRRQQPAPGDTLAEVTEKANAGTVTVISGQISGTFVQIANELSFVLDDGDRLRVLPVLGKGAEQNLRDILLLKGIDVGIVRSDGLEAVKKDPVLAEKAKSLAYITRLFTDEAHLIAGPGITDIRQLEGKKVNMDLLGSGGNYTGRLIFERLGIKVEITNYDQIASYDMLKRGEIAATFQMSGKPISSIAKLDPGPGLHLVGIPFDQRLADLYYPGEFSKVDYPNLVGGKPVDTVAVSSILAVYNHPANSERYRKVARFVDALFTKLPEFQKPPRHPKWAEVNLAANVPGWTRFKAAQDWLDRQDAKAGPDAQRASFEGFLASRGGASVPKEDREALFRDFMAWQNRGK